MSLEMITSFMQPNGALPKAAFTVVKKPNDDVEIITDSEDKAVQASLETIGRLVNLHNRIARDGLSRSTVAELQELAPAAVPGGYGLEAFTIMPSNVMMAAGLEGIVGQTLAGLKKLIKFLIEKLKAGFNILVDSYKVLTGISPTAYKLAKRQVITEQLIKNWNKVATNDLDTVVLEVLQANHFDTADAQVVLDGFFKDANTIVDNLGGFEMLISQLQRAVDELMVESALQQSAYNRMWERVNAGKVTSDEYRDMALRLSNMMDPPAFQKISKLLDQLAKKVVDSKLYKADTKDGKPIVDRLRSDKFRDILVGLQDACRQSKPTVLKTAEAYAMAKQQDLDETIEQLKYFDPVDQKSAREFKQQLDALRVYDRYVSIDMSDNDGFEVMSTKFLEQQNDVKAVIDVVRNITANYAETVFKVTAFRDHTRLVVVPKIVANTPEEKFAEYVGEMTDSLRAEVHAWVTRMVKI